MRRYTHDPRLRAFQEKIRAEVERVAEIAKDRGRVVYAIHDPTLTDPRGWYEYGPPIYVGESKQIRIRANDHMKDGGGGSTQQGIKAGRLRQILRKWVVPRFEIIDYAPSKLTALISETTWARRFRWLGYELANQWPEHQSRERPQGLDSVSLERLSDFTLADAINDEITAWLGCDYCGYGVPLPLQNLQPQVRLGMLRSLNLRCGECGRPTISFAKPAHANWRWSSYTPGKMTKPG